ncbi:MAG: hypothetical protein AAB782_01180, partial [Patescibacteria group bacterium]
AIVASVKIYCRRKEAGAAAEKQAEKQAKFYDLLARAEKGDVQAQDDLVDGGWYHKDHAENTARLEANRKIVAARRNWKTDGKPVKAAYAAWQKAVGTKEEPALCATFIRVYFVGSLLKEIRTRLVKELG